MLLNNEEDAAWIGFIQNSAGAILSPFDSWLVMRGTQTLALRMEQHDKSGRAVAAFLEEHPKVRKIYYPVRVASATRAGKRQQHGFGGMSRLMWARSTQRVRFWKTSSCAHWRKFGWCGDIDFAPRRL